MAKILFDQAQVALRLAYATEGPDQKAFYQTQAYDQLNRCLEIRMNLFGRESHMVHLTFTALQRCQFKRPQVYGPQLRPKLKDLPLRDQEKLKAKS